jgi:dienelactone hydrolase
MGWLGRVARTLGVGSVAAVLPWMTALAADPDRLPSKPDLPDLYISIERPAAPGPVPTVILLHGSSGLTLEQTGSFKRWSAWLRERGVASVVLDSQRGRHAHGEVYRGDVGAYVSILRERVVDVQRVLEWLPSTGWADPARVVLFGESQGAMAILLGALNGSLRVPQIDLYPPCGPSGVQRGYVHTNLKGYPRSLWVLAELDEVGPARDCIALDRLLTEGGAPAIKVVTIPQAHHGFDLPVAGVGTTGPRVIYSPEARDQAQVEVASFLRELGYAR